MSIGNRPPRNGDLPDSGNPKSAVVKTIELSAINTAHSWRSSQNLLGQALRSPIEISISTIDHRLASLWRPARLLFEQHQILDAIATLTGVIQQPELSANLRVPTLFLLAQVHTENGDSVAAEQCIQRGLRAMGRQTHAPRDCKNSIRTENSAKEKNQPYSLGVRDWLTLAIHSLIKSDVESSLRWIYQADRALSCGVASLSSSAHARLIGDLNAVLACLMAQNKCYEEAERCLLVAYQQHLDAESYESASRDLILTSRLATIQGQADRACALLDAAECQLILALPSDDADISLLAETIHSDRYAESAAG
jgi:hypothetical protein